ncbi:MAG: hypothetical protein HDQ88_00850 [Clostridia bacterium]|nr:hypothetical protein [Clostridia bacterium]
MSVFSAYSALNMLYLPPRTADIYPIQAFPAGKDNIQAFPAGEGVLPAVYEGKTDEGKHHPLSF